MPVTEYTWNPLNDSVMEETDGAGSVDTTYTNKPYSPGSVVSYTSYATTRWYHFDLLKSTRLLTDNDEAISDILHYDAWGLATVAYGSSPNTYRWLGGWGYQYDVPTQDYCVRARTYNSALGRWMSRDPLEFIDSTQMYIYSLNSPVMYFDIFGTFTITTTPDATRTQVKPGPCTSADINTTIHQRSGKFTLTPDEKKPLMALVAQMNTGLDLQKTSPYLIGYVQRVTIYVEATMASSKPELTAALCATNAAACICTSCGISYKYSWIEHLATFDNQNVRYEQVPITLLGTHCPTCKPFNNCCDWDYKCRVTKDVTAYPIKRDTTKAFNFESASAEVTCNGMKTALQITEKDSPQTYPGRKSAPTPGTVFPAQPITAILHYYNQVVIAHPKCGDATANITWRDYAEAAIPN